MITKKTILITGAAARIGKYLANHFAESGWNIAIHYNTSQEIAEGFVNELKCKKLSAACFQADFTKEVSYSDLLQKVTQQFGPVHCLINNASAFEHDCPQTATRESWDLHFETNLRAPFVLSQQFLKQLPEGIDGNIINIIDERVWALTPHFTSYTLSKAGLWTLTQTLALALAPNIRVNAIGPGPTLANIRQTKEHLEKQVQAVPLKRGPKLNEIAKTIDFILDAPSLTGQMIALDGGQHLGWAFPNQTVSVYD